MLISLTLPILWAYASLSFHFPTEELYSNYVIYLVIYFCCIGLTGFSNLTSLSFKRSDGVTAEGMRVFANLVNLVNLDLERCLKIHGGLIHVKGTPTPLNIIYSVTAAGT